MGSFLNKKDLLFVELYCFLFTTQCPNNRVFSDATLKHVTCVQPKKSPNVIQSLDFRHEGVKLLSVLEQYQRFRLRFDLELLVPWQASVS